jgi:peptidoglycan L-alanyl-D-glutamate endopeptidase CwlK
MDQISLDRLNLLHPKIRQEAVDIYTTQIIPALTSNVWCRIDYTLRTFKEQEELFAIGRTKLYNAQGNKLGRVTNAPAGKSFHNYGLALDIVLINGKNAVWDTVCDFDDDGTSDWMEVVNIFKKAGWTWGGDFSSFKDYPHFEKTFGYNIEECLSRHQTDQVDKFGYIIL